MFHSDKFIKTSGEDSALFVSTKNHVYFFTPVFTNRLHSYVQMHSSSTSNGWMWFFNKNGHFTMSKKNVGFNYTDFDVAPDLANW